MIIYNVFYLFYSRIIDFHFINLLNRFCLLIIALVDQLID